MLSCKKATELVEKNNICLLNLRERLQLYMHTNMCDGCMAYQKQSILIDKVLKAAAHQSSFRPVVNKLTLSPSVKEKIIGNIRGEGGVG